MASLTFQKAELKPIDITISSIPGDKSISHRAIILAALAQGNTTIHGMLFSDDCLRTIDIFTAMGVAIDMDIRVGSVTVCGSGLHGLKRPKEILDVGNSGTAIRLLSGVLACQSFSSTIRGDASIHRRPMKRVMDPLSRMGAIISGVSDSQSEDIYPPLTFLPANIEGITYTMPVASAQVKSALLLAGLWATAPTCVIEPRVTRDHTERMLAQFGASIDVDKDVVTLHPGKYLIAPSGPLHIPADFSSAAFFIVLACCRPNTSIRLNNIGMNPTRSALVNVLKKMGASIQVFSRQTEQSEAIADLYVESSDLHNICIDDEDIPIIIDEIPILAIAALHAKGTLVLRNAAELRVKESDRIQSIVAMVTAMGGDIIEHHDGFDIQGPLTTYTAFEVDSMNDHRIAMSASIAALITGVCAKIHNTECISTSFPNFEALISDVI